jgi:ribonuclease BN (tRNA processing enzyme)
VAEAGVRSRVVLLGTGTPNADPDRSGPALAVVVDQTPYLVDFGPGVVRRAMAAWKNGIVGLEPPSLKRVFLTHLHSDHTAGYPDLIFTPWVLGRREPLHVYGPPGVQRMTEHIVVAYRDDIRERVEGPEPTDDCGWLVEAHEIGAGEVYQDSSVSIHAFPVQHGSWQAFGFKFTTPDRTIVVSGDTAPSEELVEQAAGCDLLVHEVYSLRGFEDHSPDWQAYHARYHTSSRQLAQIASRTRPGLLVLYHQLFWGVSEEELLREVRAEYDGPVESGSDLAVY